MKSSHNEHLRQKIMINDVFDINLITIEFTITNTSQIFKNILFFCFPCTDFYPILIQIMLRGLFWPNVAMRKEES